MSRPLCLWPGDIRSLCRILARGLAASRDVNREIGRLNANHISIAFSSRLIDFRHFKWSGYRVEVSYAYIIDLKRNAREIWNSRFG